MQLVTVEKGQPVDTILNMNKVEETQTDDTSNAHYSSHWKKTCEHSQQDAQQH